MNYFLTLSSFVDAHLLKCQIFFCNHEVTTVNWALKGEKSGQLLLSHSFDLKKLWK